MPWQAKLMSVNVIVGLLFQANKVLVCERPASKPYAGFWEFPGGKIEANESELTALKRELQEELGISVLSAEKLFEHAHQYPDKKVHLNLYHVTAYTGEIQGLEQQKFAWVSFVELCNLKILQGNLLFLDRIKTMLNP